MLGFRLPLIILTDRNVNALRSAYVHVILRSRDLQHLHIHIVIGPRATARQSHMCKPVSEYGELKYEILFCVTQWWFFHIIRRFLTIFEHTVMCVKTSVHIPS